MMRTIKTISDHTYYTGSLPEGCKYCLEGSKLVLFITGLCPNPSFCNWYCPLSSKRKGVDDIYVNDINVTKDEDIIKEANLMEAKGAGFTGGDPLVKFDRTIKYIKLLKKEFGSKFHIHLYTTASVIEDEEKFNELDKAGLDEIRFHPNPSEWHKIKWALNTKMDVGAEVPVLPGRYKELLEFIRYLEDLKKVTFINLNELEICDANAEKLKERNYQIRDLSTVKGSHELAFRILKEVRDGYKINTHYCSAYVKGGVQLKNRMKRRAKNVKADYEEISDEGLFIKGVIIDQEQNNDVDLANFITVLEEKFNIPKEFIFYQESKNRIEIHKDYISKVADFARDKGLLCGIVEEWSGKNRFDVTFNPC
ncbi:MAG: radical SAM protein [Candidatus Lokiarchaeota archaeon]|nr:radical SAM protein [Candidatus Lokiarchaeota archaeon]